MEYNKKEFFKVASLLLVPYYLIFILIEEIFGLSKDNLNLLAVVLILPILIGLYISRKRCTGKISKILFALELISLAIGLYFYVYAAYFAKGWDGLGYMVLMLFSLPVIRFILYIYIGKIFGYKNSYKDIFIFALFEGAILGLLYYLL